MLEKPRDTFLQHITMTRVLCHKISVHRATSNKQGGLQIINIKYNFVTHIDQ